MPNHRKPNEIHILQGTARADRGTDVVVTVEGDLARNPLDVDYSKGFDRDEMFKLVSQWVAHMTGEVKVDEMAIVMLLDQLEIYSVSKADVKARGSMLHGDKGQYVNHSLYNMNTAHDKIVKMMREFGMTPATRGSVKASNQMDKDPMDLIMKGPK